MYFRAWPHILLPLYGERRWRRWRRRRRLRGRYREKKMAKSSFSIHTWVACKACGPARERKPDASHVFIVARLAYELRKCLACIQVNRANVGVEKPTSMDKVKNGLWAFASRHFAMARVRKKSVQTRGRTRMGNLACAASRGPARRGRGGTSVRRSLLKSVSRMTRGPA